MDDLNRKVEGIQKSLAREQCYIGMMTPTDAPPPTGKSPQEVRIEHHEYLLDLERRGVLFGAGPFVDENGKRHGAGMIIIRAKSRAEAEKLAFAEPYTKYGMRKMELTPWQRNEGSVNLTIRFADGVLTVDDRTYALKVEK